MKLRWVVVSVAIIAALVAFRNGQPTNQSAPDATSVAVERHTTTYRLLEQVAAVEYPLAETPTIYILGETHLGKSQIEVARIASDALRQYDLDAVFLEQPDSLTFNDDAYQNLRAAPEAAIAALQQEMLDDANRPIEYNFGKFKPFFDAYRQHKDDKRLATEITAAFGSSAVDELNDIFTQQESDIKATNELYERSEYVSAFDYLYLMLRLEAIDIPFVNIESLELRDKFTAVTTADPEAVNRELGPRDEYMTAKLDSVAKGKGYRQMLLVCGALHLPALPARLRSKGYNVEVLYNSLEKEGIKKEMAVLSRPDRVQDIVKGGTRAGFAVSDAYIVRHQPARQTQASFDSFLSRNVPTGFATPEQVNGLRKQFAEAFAANQIRGKEAWTLDLPTENGRVVRAARDGAAGSFSLAALSPINLGADPQPEAVAKRPLVLTVADLGSHFQLKSANEGGRVLYAGLDMSAVAKQVNEVLGTAPSQTVYLDLDGLAPDKQAAFTSSLRIQLPRESENIDIRAYAHTKGEGDPFFSGKAVVEVKAARVEEIVVGERKGWFAVTCDVLVGGIKRATLRIVAKTREALQIALTLFGEMQASPRFQGTSLAALVTEVKWELKHQHGMNDNDVLFEFDDQIGQTQFVSVAPVPDHRTE